MSQTNTDIITRLLDFDKKIIPIIRETNSDSIIKIELWDNTYKQLFFQINNLFLSKITNETYTFSILKHEVLKKISFIEDSIIGLIHRILIEKKISLNKKVNFTSLLNEDQTINFNKDNSDYPIHLFNFDKNRSNELFVDRKYNIIIELIDTTIDLKTNTITVNCKLRMVIEKKIRKIVNNVEHFTETNDSKDSESPDKNIHDSDSPRIITTNDIDKELNLNNSNNMFNEKKDSIENDSDDIVNRNNEDDIVNKKVNGDIIDNENDDIVNEEDDVIVNEEDDVIVNEEDDVIVNEEDDDDIVNEDDDIVNEDDDINDNIVNEDDDVNDNIVNEDDDVVSDDDDVSDDIVNEDDGDDSDIINEEGDISE
jgi:hypothetical protein